MERFRLLVEDHTHLTRAIYPSRNQTSGTLLFRVKQSRVYGREYFIPIAVPVAIVVANQILLPSCTICTQLQRLIDRAQEVVSVIGRDVDKGSDVFLDLCRRKSTHEVEHVIEEIAHGRCNGLVEVVTAKGRKGLSYWLQDHRLLDKDKLRSDTTPNIKLTIAS